MGGTCHKEVGAGEHDDKEIRKHQKKYFCSFTEKPMGFDKHLFNIVWFGILPHTFGIIGYYNFFTFKYPLGLMVFQGFYYMCMGYGITIGAHRYWTHKCFKAKLPLQILLCFLQTSSGQHSLFKWCRDHRVHHKFVDSEADPHNSRKGFWYSHILWLITPDNPEFVAKWDSIDMSDLDNDPIVRFQAKYYWSVLVPLCVFIIPMSIINFLVPGLSMFELLCINYCWIFHLHHSTFMVNSVAHLWGYRSYDKGINPRENIFVSFFAGGEGFHNYHHTFPWDYKAAELGQYRLNWSTLVIDFFEWIGWAYDLKSVPMKIVSDRVKRTGDASHPVYKEDADQKHSESEKPVWGWGDVDMTKDDYKVAVITQPSKVECNNS